MSFNSQASLNFFYDCLGTPAPVFKQHVEAKFLPDLKKPFVKGGAKSSQRKKVIQEAVDAMQCYGELDPYDAASKRAHFESAYRALFKQGLPPNSNNASVQSVKLKQIDAKCNILREKLRLLCYWEELLTAEVIPEHVLKSLYDEKTGLDNEKEYQRHFLYCLPATKVKPILQILLNDARDVLDKQAFTATMQAKVVADTNIVKRFDSTDISKTVKFEASARAGFQGNAKFELEYEGLKGELSGEVFAGIRGKLEAEGKIAPGQLAVSGNVHVDVGIVIKGDAKFDIGDLLEVEASAEGLAGAQLDAGGKIVVSYEGVELDLHAEAFAGVRIKGHASGKLKLGGRAITTVKGEVAAWAGAGASAQLGFKCSVFGEISFKAKAGAAVGVGASGGLALTLDPKAIQYGTLNLVFAYASEHGIKAKGRVHFLPLEENAKMSELAKVAIKGMIKELEQRNESEMQKLKRWNIVRDRMVGGQWANV